MLVVLRYRRQDVTISEMVEWSDLAIRFSHSPAKPLISVQYMVTVKLAQNDQGMNAWST